MDQQAYIQILEKINQQLSYQWTPINVTIAALAVLFTVGAIGATIFIYLQGKEYRKRSENLLKSESEKWEKLIKDSQSQFINYQKQLSHLINKYKDTLEKLNKKLEKLSKKPRDQKELEKFKKEIYDKLQQLNKEKDNLPTPILGGISPFSTLTSSIDDPIGPSVVPPLQKLCKMCHRPIDADSFFNYCESCKNSWPGGPLE